MTRRGFLVLAILGLCTFQASSELYPKMGTIIVRVNAVGSEKGRVHVHLFDTKSSWMKNERAVATLSAAAVSPTMTLKLKAPLNRRYALSVHHDENGNGKMDTGFPIPKPTEPVAASYHEGKSIPRFYECSFLFKKSPMEVAVTLVKP